PRYIDIAGAVHGDPAGRVVGPQGGRLVIQITIYKTTAKVGGEDQRGGSRKRGIELGNEGVLSAAEGSLERTASGREIARSRRAVQVSVAGAVQGNGPRFISVAAAAAAEIAGVQNGRRTRERGIDLHEEGILRTTTTRGTQERRLEGVRRHGQAVL